jgi:hypothetical protein
VWFCDSNCDQGDEQHCPYWILKLGIGFTSHINIPNQIGVEAALGKLKAFNKEKPEEVSLRRKKQLV